MQPPFRRSVLVALALALLFLAGTGYVSVVTLLDRIESTGVMKAVSSDFWSPSIVGHIVFFVLSQLVLHAAMAAVALLLAYGTVQVWPELRHKVVRLLVGWFCLLSIAVIAYNALWYPRTFFGAHYYSAMRVQLGPFHLGEWIYGSILLAAAAVLGAAGIATFRAPSHKGRRWVLAGLGAAVLAVTWAAIPQGATPKSASSAEAGQPNIIVLGIDSLRLDELQRFGGKAGNAAHIDEFLRDADIVMDSSTPMPRTFGSWVTILSGRSPVATGARNNLTPRDAIAANPTIADLLRTAGYHTVYSTDEVRFANIDESYGFSQIITPPISAADFILGTYNELPLPSVVINTRLGEALFPFSYGNRGAAQVFRPETFLQRLDRELAFDRPTFLVVHLTAAHWPYYTAETPFGIVPKDEHDRPMYRAGLVTVDRMFGELTTLLRRKGAFDNAIVVTLSDHGEALMLPNDAIVKKGANMSDLRAPIKVLNVGHGQSVLSPTQYQILLAFQAFGGSPGFSHSGRAIGMPATAEDIAPTLLELVNVPSAPLASSGVSLAPLLRGTAQDPGVVYEGRVRFTETDLTVIPETDGGIDEAQTARRNARFFGIEPRSGRLQIRHPMLPLAHAFKERAAFTPGHIIAALPAGPRAHQYLYFDKATGAGRLLLERPGPELPEGAHLWDALHAHYGEELMPPVRTELSDWPEIDRAWRDFFKDARNTARATGTGSSVAPGAAE